jgi:sulfoxide reductase heme-binding subunit YedZ
MATVCFSTSMVLIRTRMRRRLLRHHLPLLLVSAGSVAALYYTRPYRDFISRGSFATAYPALALLAATLLIGPWNLLRKRTNPISSDLRRDIGIWAGVLGIVHTAVGQFDHLRGHPWLYYIYDPHDRQHTFPVRHDLFGFANCTGALGVLILAALLATSNDSMLRKLHTRTWKQLQRWNYAVFALVAAHTFAYQGTERQQVPFVLTAALCVAIAIAFQGAGIVMKRRASPAWLRAAGD